MISIGKVISSRLKNARSLIKLLGFGLKDTHEINQALPFGEDSRPIKDLIAVYASTSSKGEEVVIGYINPDRIADVGEKRMYSTDNDGNTVFYLHMKNDGTAEFNGDADNMVRYSELESAFNELKTDFNDLVQTWNTFATAYAPGSPSTVGTPPTASNASASTADITPAKIEEIKTN